MPSASSPRKLAAQRFEVMTALPVDRARGVRRVLWLTLGLNLAVALAKIAYGAYAGSLAIRADGFHSLTDSSNNVVGLVGVALASRPADSDHPYGHEKIEAMAAGLVGLSLLALAVDVGRGAWSRMFGEAQPTLLGPVAFVVLLGTLAVNLAVARYEAREAVRLKSSMLESDAEHTRSDALVTLGVLASVIGVLLGAAWLDWVAALGVSGFIAWAGVGVLKRNLGYLADSARLDPALIEAAALRVPAVAGAHKIRTRGTPGAIHVDLHIQIAPHLDVVQAHQVTHWVIEAIQHDLGEVKDVVVHTEPAAPGQPHTPLPEGWKPAPGD